MVKGSFVGELNQIREIYKLKSVERANSCGVRKESSAEHSWSCLVLADIFLSKMEGENIDRLRVYELLMYHDLIEIEVGDACISKEELRRNKKELEHTAMLVLKEKLSESIAAKYVDLFVEFEEMKTTEARFSKAIDALDALLHEIDYKADWKGWSEAFLRSKKGYLFEEFPVLKDVFEMSIAFCKTEGYFD